MTQATKDALKIVGTICLVIGCLIGIGKYFRGARKEPPFLVAIPPPSSIDDRTPFDFGAPEPRSDQPLKRVFTPLAQHSPTIVPVENHGGRQALIQSVSFQIKGRRPTPFRENLAAKPTAIPVNFLKRHYHQKTHSFDLMLRNPVSVQGDGEAACFEVAIVSKPWVGFTYAGTFVVRYAGGQTLRVDNVELDVLPKPPPPPASN